MSNNIPIKERINKKLGALDFMHIKQALISYLADKDWRV